MDLNAYLTTFISLGVAVITYQQWRTIEMQRRQALFELRYEKILKRYFNFIDEINDITRSKEAFNGDKYNLCTSQFTSDFFEANFLISESDRNELMTIYNNIINESTKVICGKWAGPGEEYTVRTSFYFFLNGKKEEIYKIMERYLRAEYTSFIEKYFPNFKKGFDGLKNILSRDINICVLWQEILQKIFIILKRGGIVQKRTKRAGLESANGVSGQGAK